MLVTKKVLLPFLLLFVFFNGYSQELSYGFRAGLNFSRILGPAEENNSGDKLEDFKYFTGFHVGAGLIIKLTDIYGIKTEVLFSQKGGRLNYEGDSYFILTPSNSMVTEEIITTGNRRSVLTYSNSYIDIPITGYAKIGRIEFMAGLNVGFLVASSGAGELIYNGVSEAGNELDFTVGLDYNYFGDEPGEATFDDESTTVNIDGEQAVLPSEAGGYWLFEEDNGNNFAILDLGLNAGFAFYLNAGLYLGFRANLGLVDITNNDYDQSLLELDMDNTIISRSDIDRNFNFQVSLGFSF